jgi:hypothetical protein
MIVIFREVYQIRHDYNFIGKMNILYVLFVEIKRRDWCPTHIVLCFSFACLVASFSGLSIV